MLIGKNAGTEPGFFPMQLGDGSIGTVLTGLTVLTADRIDRRTD